MKQRFQNRVAWGALLLAAAAPLSLSAHESDALHVHGFGEVGARLLGGEAFLAVRPGVAVESERLSIVLAPLLHFGFEQGRPRPREEDFDSPSDLGRVLHVLRFTSRDERWRARAGSLSLETLGSGAVVSDYVASLDPDSPHTALRLDWTDGRWDLSALTSGLFDPVIVAGRIELAPVALLDGAARAARSWRVGLLGALDPTAPVELTLELARGRKPGATKGSVALSSLDTALTVYRDHRFGLEVYLDAVVITAGPRKGSSGGHFGLVSALEIQQELHVLLRAEGRRLGSGYIPEYFDSLYSIERWGFPVGSAVPKASSDSLESSWGGKLELELGRQGSGLVALSLDGREGGPGNAAVRLLVSGDSRIMGAMVVSVRGLHWEAEGAPWGMGVAEVRWHFSRVMYLVGRGGRTFRVDQQVSLYLPVWDASLMLGAVL